MAVTGISLLTSLAINGAICLIAIAVFSYLRNSKLGKRYYAPKRFDPEIKRRPPQLSNGFIDWIKPVLLLPEEEIIAVAGLDCLVFIQLLYYGFLIFAFCTFLCCALLMPINGTAGFLATTTDQWTDLDLLSVSNVPPASQRYWAHMITAYLITGVALYLLLMFSKDLSRTRAAYLATLPRGATSHSVLVTDIPGLGTGIGAKLASLGSVSVADPEKGGAGADPAADPHGDAAAKLQKLDAQAFVEGEMRQVYGTENVAAVNVVYDTRKLDPLTKKYDAQKTSLQDVTEDYILKANKGTKVEKRREVSLWSCFAPKWAKEKYHPGAVKPAPVDALEYMPQNLEHLHADVVKERDAVKGAPVPAAFVTFNNRFTQAVASTGLQAYDETSWRVQPAPGPTEIIWGNLGMSYYTKVVRNTAMWAVFVLILIFYLPVTALIQALVNINNLLSIGGPALAAVINIPFVRQIIEGILPGLVLKIFLILLPPILAAMARFEGKVSLSQVDFSIVSRFFIFQVFATFIYQFLVGSAMGAIDSITKNPGVIVEILGVSAAKSASFFMTYVMINACAVGLGLLNIVGFIIYIVLDKIAGTERAKYRLWSKQMFSFGTNTANHTIILLLGLAFCCLSPLIAPFCMLYFVLALLAQQYKLVYVFSREYEATGSMWLSIFHQIMVGIYFLQAMVACVLGVKKFPYVILIIPLPVLTLWFHIVMTGVFKRPWTLMSLREAAALDAADGDAAMPAEEREAISKLYVNPGFKVDEAEHQKLLDNAKAVDENLKAGGGPIPIQVTDLTIAEDT